MDHKDGGPAYPAVKSDGWSDHIPGMTLRQAYKIAAMQGLLGSPGITAKYGTNHVESNLNLALVCGALADAMLAEDAEHAARSAPPSGEKEGERAV